MILTGKIDLTGVPYVYSATHPITVDGKVIGSCKIQRDGTVTMDVPDSYYPLLCQNAQNMCFCVPLKMDQSRLKLKVKFGLDIDSHIRPTLQKGGHSVS